MKIASFLFALLLAIVVQVASAQETGIRYDIQSMYTTLPTSGNSNQLRSSIEYDDTTQVIENFSFEVPLFTFISDYGSYNHIAALGAANTFPYLRFESSKIQQDGKDLIMKGSLYFRGSYRPITIRAKRTEEQRLFYIDGSFTVNIRDYFMFSGGRGIPPYMNIDFRVVFDKTKENQ